MSANAGTTRRTPKTGACDESLGRPRKPEEVQDAECKEGEAQKCIDKQIGRNTEDGNGYAATKAAPEGVKAPFQDRSCGHPTISKPTA